MNRKQKKELRQRKSTRQLMGIVRITPHGVQTESGERAFYLIRPDNLSVLSPEVIQSRIRSLTVLLSTQPSIEILALDSRESFQRNKEYYQRRIEEESVPEVRALLEKDLEYLEDGRLELSNNRAERSIKPFVMGRKNWLFANTPGGAQASAMIYSLIETAKENKLDPYKYLLWVLQSAPGLSQADEFWAEKLLPANAPQECHVPQ